MVTKAQLIAELEALPESEYDGLFAFLRRSKPLRNGAGKGGILAKLGAIQLDGPVDFSANLDQYLNGEKRVEENLP